jgi:hypothetical protein
MDDFSVWISAESWAPGEWTPENDATDVAVTLADGSRWVATFCSFTYVETLRANWSRSGECLGGRYVWMTSLVLVEDTSRATTEAVVRDLLASGEFQSAFAASPATTSDRAI